jgi:hypothetical protein
MPPEYAVRWASRSYWLLGNPSRRIYLPGSWWFPQISDPPRPEFPLRHWTNTRVATYGSHTFMTSPAPAGAAGTLESAYSLVNTTISG